MSNRPTIIIGSLIILVGFISLINALFHINLWDYFWPVVLICLGALLLLRPQIVTAGTQVRFIPLGDIQRSGSWQVTPEEIWTFVGDIDLDLTKAEIPAGETKIRILGFVGDVSVLAPQGVGISLSSWAFVTDGRAFGNIFKTFFSPLQVASPGYETAERKVRLEATYFVFTLGLRSNKSA